MATTHVGLLVQLIRLGVGVLYYGAASWTVLDISTRAKGAFRETGLAKGAWLSLAFGIFGAVFFVHVLAYVAAGFAVNYLTIARPKMRRMNHR